MALAAASVCLVRLIAQASTPSGLLSLCLAGAGVGSALVNGSFGAVTPYVPVSPCGAALELRDAASGALLAPVAPAAAQPPANGSRASVLAVGARALGTVGAAAFADADAQLPETADNIDAAWLRVCNAIDGPGTVRLVGAQTECFNCLRTRLIDAAYATCSDYTPVDTTWGWNLGVADNQGLQASSTAATFTPLEHGAYTIVVRNAVYSMDANALLSWQVDVEGRDAALPVLYAALALAALVVVHALGAAAAARYVAVGKGAAKVAAARATKELTLFSFFDINTRVAELLELKEDGAGAGSEPPRAASLNAGGGGALSEKLLEAEETASPTPSAPGAAPTTKPRSAGRLVSIDALRGMCLAIMIFVNSSGGRYNAFFDHSRWNGLQVPQKRAPTHRAKQTN